MSLTPRPPSAPAAAHPTPSPAALPHRLLGWPDAVAERGPDVPSRPASAAARPVGGSQAVRRLPAPARRRHAWPLTALLVLVGALLLLAAGMARAADDPPGRVGRIAWIEGDADLERADGGDPLRHSRESLRNWPVTEGDRLFLAADSRAELDIGSTRLRLGAGTELQFKRLDDEAIEIDLQRGSLAVLLRSDEVARELSIDTPAGRLLPLASGLFRADAPDSGHPSATAWRAGLEIEQSAGRYTLQPGQRAELYADGGLRFMTPAADAFARWAMSTDELRAPQTAQAAQDSPVPEEMTGADQLERHGDWVRSPEDGWVWFPRAVVVGWAPYRHGRWSWVSPWGWTWIDDAPWGFAPFHYGRWVYWRDRWGWVPGERMRRPVYAPALVVWNGRPGVSWSVTIGSGLAWYPLGPREVYVPPYRAGPRYVTGVNRPHVRDGVLLGRAIERPDEVLRGTPYRYRGFVGAISTVGPREGRDGRDGRDDRHGWRATPWRGGTERLAPSLRAPEAPPAVPRLTPPRAPDATRGPVGRDERGRNAPGRDERAPVPAPDRPERPERPDRVDRPAATPDPRDPLRNERGAGRGIDRPNDRLIDRNGDGVPDRPSAPIPAQIPAPTPAPRANDADARTPPAPTPPVPSSPAQTPPARLDATPVVPRSNGPQAPNPTAGQAPNPAQNQVQNPVQAPVQTPAQNPAAWPPRAGPREGLREVPRDANPNAPRDANREFPRDGREPPRAEPERRVLEPSAAPERPRPPAAPAVPPPPAPTAAPALQPTAPQPRQEARPEPRPEQRPEPRPEPRQEPRVEPRQEARPPPPPTRMEPPRAEPPRPEMRTEPRREPPAQRPDTRCDAGDPRCDNRGGNRRER